MQGKNHGRQQSLLVLGLSGCLLVLITLMCFATAALTGLYLYDHYDLSTLRAGIQSLPAAADHMETPVVQEALPALATLAPPAAATVVLPGLPVAQATVMPTPTAAFASAGAVPVALDQIPVPSNAYSYLERLYLADHPAHDYYESAVHLGKLDIGERTVSRPSFNKGDQQIFQTEDGSVAATLMAVSDHAYFWVDDTLLLNAADLEFVARQLEGTFYGRVNHLFGEAWEPGIDGDPRFSILHLAGDGNVYELGYFSDQDEYPRTLFRESNEQEIVYLNMGQLDLGSELYYGTLVHEIQHLFQWNLDKNEATWFNEGLSQLAELYAGLATAVPEPYLEQPDIRLDRWSYEDSKIDAHYAGSFLFLTYLWEQLGDDAVYELVRHPANGLVAVANILQGFQPDRTLQDFTADWAVANYLDDPFAGERFAYSRLDLPRPSIQTRIRQLPFTDLRDVEQFGVHYIDIDHGGAMTLTFAGDTTARLIDSAPPSGEQMWYALPFNDSDARLTAEFDLRQHKRATLSFNAWYDLELGYDFAYVSVSADDGASWEVLRPQHRDDGDYGPGLSGESSDVPGAANGWVRESLSLDQYAGQKILVRFQVLTDFETVGRGFALDDIAITELGYFDDVESGTGSWQAQGFVRTGWLLPQQWAIRFIKHGDQPVISTFQLNALNQVRERITTGDEGGTLVIMPQTPFVDETGQYWLHVE